MPQLVIREMAARMTYEDLPSDIKAKVNTMRESVVPKYQSSQLASDLLSQWCNRGVAMTAA